MTTLNDHLTRDRIVATRDRNADLEELRLERIAIEGEIDTLLEQRVRQQEAQDNLDRLVDETKQKLAEQRTRLRARIDAIYRMEMGE